MVKTNRYDLSFTGFSLRVIDMANVAIVYREKGTVDYQVFGEGKSSTAKKWFNEIYKRLKTLTPRQLNLLIEGDLEAKKQVGFLSVCKKHLFIRDFTVEVIREKLLIYDYQITEGEYLSFFRRKAELHPELDGLTETSKKKVKQVTFRILEQAGIIDNAKNKSIQPQLLEEKVIHAIAEDEKEWLKILLMSDLEIENLNRYGGTGK